MKTKKGGLARKEIFSIVTAGPSKRKELFLGFQRGNYNLNGRCFCCVNILEFMHALNHACFPSCMYSLIYSCIHAIDLGYIRQ